MNLQTERELENTRAKLRLLEAQIDVTQARASDNEHVRELALRSLRTLVNQLKEEIARFECRQTARPDRSGVVAHVRRARRPNTRLTAPRA